MELEDEAKRLELLLRGKTIRKARRTEAGELLVEFEDGLRLYARIKGNELDLSVTPGPRSSET